jgi:hypothetical protein
MSNYILIKRKKYKIKITFILLFLFCIVTFSAIFISPAFGIQKQKFIEVEVNPGDTLWKIAKENGPDNQDIRKTIYYIKKYNGLKTSYIYSGQKLKVPVYFE